MKHKRTNRRWLIVLIGLALVIGLMSGMGVTAKAETGTETINVNIPNAKEVSGEHFKVTSGSDLKTDETGMGADHNGITITPLNNEWITKVVVTVTYGWSEYASYTDEQLLLEQSLLIKVIGNSQSRI